MANKKNNQTPATENKTAVATFDLLTPLEQAEEVKRRIDAFDTREVAKTQIVLWSKEEILQGIQRVEKGLIDTEKAIAKAENGYLSIINDLVMLEKSATPIGSKGGVMLDGVKYTSFKAFCEKKFGMGKQTFYNLKTIWDRFTDENGRVPQAIVEIGQRPLLRYIQKEVEAEKQAQEKARKALEDKQRQENGEAPATDNTETPATDNSEAPAQQNTETPATPTEKKVSKQRIFSTWKELVGYVQEEEWQFTEGDLVLTLRE